MSKEALGLNALAEHQEGSTKEAENKALELLREKAKKAQDEAEKNLEAQTNLFAKLSTSEGSAILGEGKDRGKGVAKEAPEANVPDMTPKKGLPREDNLAGSKD